MVRTFTHRARFHFPSNLFAYSIKLNKYIMKENINLISVLVDVFIISFSRHILTCVRSPKTISHALGSQKKIKLNPPTSDFCSDRDTRKNVLCAHKAVHVCSGGFMTLQAQFVRPDSNAKVVLDFIVSTASLRPCVCCHKNIKDGNVKNWFLIDFFFFQSLRSSILIRKCIFLFLLNYHNRIKRHKCRTLQQ